MTTEEWDGVEYETDLHAIWVQCVKDSDAWFPNIAPSLAHHVLALCGETGELANLVKKVQRGSLEMDEKTRFDITMEATDVLIYVLNIFGCLQYSPAFAYHVKREENIERFGRTDGRNDGALRSAPPESVVEGS